MKMAPSSRGIDQLRDGCLTLCQELRDGFSAEVREALSCCGHGVFCTSCLFVVRVFLYIAMGCCRRDVCIFVVSSRGDSVLRDALSLFRTRLRRVVGFCMSFGSLWCGCLNVETGWIVFPSFLGVFCLYVPLVRVPVLCFCVPLAGVPVLCFCVPLAVVPVVCAHCVCACACRYGSLSMHMGSSGSSTRSAKAVG